MRILNLTLTNLNSLTGTWVIDFEDVAYQKDGLFAITGPTGAGKTTILDAICLALYGKTPRLKDRDDFTAKSNEIMSRHSDHCESAVVFQTSQGMFRAEFSHKRTMKAKLPFKETEWRIFRLTKTGDVTVEEEITPHRKDEHDDARLEMIGMDYAQFCRAVLLAQGDFRQFLAAKPEEKAALLEKITGTQIYTIIGRKVAEQCSEENRKLNTLNERLDEIRKTILADEEVARLTQAQVELPEQQKQQETLRETVQTHREWRNHLDTLQTKFNAAKDEVQKLNEENKRLAPHMAALKKDERTRPLASEYQELTAVQKSTDSAKEKCRLAQQQVHTNEKECTGLETKIHEQQTAVTAAQTEWDGNIEVLKNTRELDIVLRSLRISLHDSETKKNERIAVCEKLDREITRLKKETAESPQIAEKIARYRQQWNQEIGEQMTGTDLATQLQEVTERLSQWEKLKNTTETKEQLALALKEEQQKSQNMTVELETLQKEQIELDKQDKSLEDQITQHEEHLRQIQAISSLETERKKLQDGVACPLCGSLEHPFASGVIATPAEEEVVLKTLRRKQKSLSSEREKWAQRKGTAETTLQQSQKQQQMWAQQSVVEEQSRQKLLAEMNLPVVLSAKEITDITAIEDQLRAAEDQRKKVDGQMKLAKKLEKEITAGQKELDALKTKQQELSHFEAQQPTAIEEQRLAETTFREAEQKAKTVAAERFSLLGDKNPDTVEDELQTTLKSAQIQWQSLKDRLTKLKGELEQQYVSLETHKQETVKYETELAQKMETFRTQLTAAGFPTIDDFIAARLSDSDRKKLQDQKESLDKRHNELQGRIDTVTEDVQKEQAKKMTPLSAAELDVQKKSLDNEIREIITKIAQCQTMLADDRNRRKTLEDRTQEREKQAATTARWKNLNDLIGTANNPKFTRIVQRMSLEILLDHANVQLKLLTPRYQLILRDVSSGKETMSIYCCDTFLNNEIRPTDNLSGGESFLISLALALGLSKMSSDKISIGSLFLDEGFGTLDEETLNMALDALVHFQSSDAEQKSGDGKQKLIGIISHVDSLKDRIANKIEVSQIASGKSKLHGPGVTR